MLKRRKQSVPFARDEGRRRPEAAPLSDVRAGVPVGPSRRDKRARAAASRPVRERSRVHESAADDFFRADAERLGYLTEDGPGLRAYYRDHGMIQPEVLDKELPRIEIVGGWEFDGGPAWDGAPIWDELS